MGINGSFGRRLQTCQHAGSAGDHGFTCRAMMVDAISSSTNSDGVAVVTIERRCRRWTSGSAAPG